MNVFRLLSSCSISVSYHFNNTISFSRLEWETSVVKGAGMLESLEEERLAQLKSSADCYLRLTAAVPPQLAEVS